MYVHNVCTQHIYEIMLYLFTSFQKRIHVCMDIWKSIPNSIVSFSFCTKIITTKYNFHVLFITLLYSLAPQTDEKKREKIGKAKDTKREKNPSTVSIIHPPTPPQFVPMGPN